VPHVALLRIGPKIFQFPLKYRFFATKKDLSVKPPNIKDQSLTIFSYKTREDFAVFFLFGGADAEDGCELIHC